MGVIGALPYAPILIMAHTLLVEFLRDCDIVPNFFARQQVDQLAGNEDGRQRAVQHLSNLW